jgi:hypothetical protein
MRSLAAQKKQARRLEKHRVARKALREAEATRAQGTPRPRVATRAVYDRNEHAAKRIAGRLAKLVPEVRRRFTRALGPAGYELTLIPGEHVQVRVANGPVYAVRVESAWGAPIVGVFLGERTRDSGPLAFERRLGDWAAFVPTPGLRHLAKTAIGRGATLTIEDGGEPVELPLKALE